MTPPKCFHSDSPLSGVSHAWHEEAGRGACTLFEKRDPPGSPQAPGLAAGGTTQGCRCMWHRVETPGKPCGRRGAGSAAERGLSRSQEALPGAPSALRGLEGRGRRQVLPHSAVGPASPRSSPERAAEGSVALTASEGPTRAGGVRGGRDAARSLTPCLWAERPDLLQDGNGDGEAKFIKESEKRKS